MSEPKKIKLPKHYESIDDMPMYNWNKIHETGDMKYMTVHTNTVTDKQAEELGNIWKSIYDEYVRSFGFSEVFKNIILKKVEIAKLKVQKIVTGDETIDNFIQRAANELKATENKANSGDINKVKIAIEKAMGFHISLREVTVREFYNYSKYINTKK